MQQKEAVFDRRQGLGGSDIAAVLGVSPYDTAFDVYSYKLGFRPPKAETPEMRFGKLLEPVLRQVYEQDHGLAVVPGLAFDAPPLWHPNGICYAHPDGWVEHVGAGTVGLWEGKTAGHDLLWQGGVPLFYEVQVRVYLAITKLPWCDVTVLFRDTATFAHYRINADPEYDEAIVARAAQWWERHIEAETPPDIDGSESATEYLLDRWPSHEPGTAVTAPESAEEMAVDLIMALGRKARAEEEENILKNRLRLLMQEAERMQGNGWNVLYRQGKPTRKTDWQLVAGAYRKAAANVLTDEKADAIVSLYTVEREGTRPFLFRVEKGDSA